MSGFLSSFKSEYRVLTLNSISKTKDEYGEMQSTIDSTQSIKAILFRRKYRAQWGLVQSQVQAINTEWVLYLPLEYEVKENDQVVDGDREYRVTYVLPIYAFGGKLDHNQCSLELIQ